jgi:hypothetical protein
VIDEPIIAEGRGYRLTRLPLASELIAIGEAGDIGPLENMAIMQLINDGNFIDDRKKKPARHNFIYLDGSPRPES